MLTVAIFNLVVVLIAYFAYLLRSVRWLQLSFFLIFLSLALRYDFGNDYHNYLVGFDDINAFDKVPDFELGWVFLCRLFSPLGFFALVAVLAAFNCVVYYRFIKTYVPPAYYWFAVFLYVFNADMMLVHSSAMRQSVAIAIFVYAIDYLYERNLVRYCLCVGLASLFHTSALILLPICLLGVFNSKITSIMAGSLFVMFALLLVFVESLRPYIDRFVNAFFEMYAVYQMGGDQRIGTGLAFAFRVVVFALVLFYAQYQTGALLVLFKIAILAFFIEPLAFDIVMLSRGGMYVQPALVAVLPVVFWNMSGQHMCPSGSFMPAVSRETSRAAIVRRNAASGAATCMRKAVAGDPNIYLTTTTHVIVAAYLVITLYSFYGFFQSEVWRDRFGTYKTIFSAPVSY